MRKRLLILGAGATALALLLALGSLRPDSGSGWRLGGTPDGETRGLPRVVRPRVSVDGEWEACSSAHDAKLRPCREELPLSTFERASSVLHNVPRADHRQALASLLFAREPSQLADAERILESISLEPGPPAIGLDLSAVKLRRAWSQGHVPAFAEAFELADRLLRDDPLDARACFNRAHALEGLGLEDPALAGWRRCAEIEPEPGWQAEAVAHVRSLGEALGTTTKAPSLSEERLDRAIAILDAETLRELGRTHPQAVVESVVRRLLPAWAAREGAAEELPPALHALATAVAEATDDRFLLDLAEDLRSLRRVADWRRFTEGARALARGLELYGATADGSARRALDEAARLLADVEPLRNLARAYLGTRLHTLGETEAARSLLASVAERSGPATHLWPLSIATYSLARIAYHEGRLLEARDLFSRALDTDERGRTAAGTVRDRAALAEVYSDLGWRDLAFELAAGAVQQAYELGEAHPLFFALNQFEVIASHWRSSRLALLIQSTALEHAGEERPRVLSNALSWKARRELELGDRDQALADLARAESIARRVPETGDSSSLTAELSLTRGVLLQTVEPLAAIDDLTAAVRFFADSNYPNYVSALTARAAALRELGEIDRSIADLIEAVAAQRPSWSELQRLPSTAGAETAWLAYANRNATALEAMVAIHLQERGQPWAALAAVEWANRLRAPGPARQTGSPEGDPRGWGSELSEGEGLLVFSGSGADLVAWLLTRDDAVFRELAPLQAVRGSLGRLQRARDLDSWREESESLFERLLAPFRAYLPALEELNVIPGEGVAAVPFPGLLDRDSGRFLVEEVTLRLLPNVWALTAPRAPARPFGGEAVVLADPASPVAELLGLAPLPFAREEGSSVAAALGAGVRLLTGEEATPSAFLEAASGARWIHVAAHATSRPWESRAALLLAPDPQSPDGTLDSLDVLELAPLASTELVVISACSTAASADLAWISSQVLARSFLAAGARVVVATLAPVDDEETALLVGSFYRNVAKGEESAVALRSAQVETLLRGTSTSAPPSWPYFVQLGL